MWETATHFGAGHHRIHVLGGVVMGEVSSVRERARNFGAGPAVLQLLNRLSRDLPDYGVELGSLGDQHNEHLQAFLN
jgi:hypothetical protein